MSKDEGRRMNSIPQAKPTAGALGTAPVCPLSFAPLESSRLPLQVVEAVEEVVMSWPGKPLCYTNTSSLAPWQSHTMPLNSCNPLAVQAGWGKKGFAVGVNGQRPHTSDCFHAISITWVTDN